MFDRAGQRKYLNRYEREAFLKTVWNVRDLKRRTFCLSLFFTGCRISEALNVTIERVDFAEKSIVFKTLKRRSEKHYRSVPVPDELLALLRQQIGEAPTESRVWEFSRATGYRLIKAQMKRARAQGGMASPKGLRHGFAVACIESKIPLTTVRKWLGHARLETTAIYLEVAGNEERRLAKLLWAKSKMKR